ncbi:MAG: DUF1016 N-terminal domain-containing protein, partial [Promicromonosporaceae bacterium]|nr:DUF1016 N-terminal domain-containing protein [Promicromonosporaceae bacterium]
MSDLKKPDGVLNGNNADLFARVASLIDEGRAAAATQVNVARTLTYWRVGREIGTEILGGDRAEYGAQIVATLSRDLTTRFGRGFEKAQLNRMVQFATAYPDAEIVATLSRQ